MGNRGFFNLKLRLRFTKDYKMAKKYHGEKKGMGRPPEKLVMKDYPKAVFGCAEKYNDSLEGIDMLAKSNKKQINKKPGGRY